MLNRLKKLRTTVALAVALVALGGGVAAAVNLNNLILPLKGSPHSQDVILSGNVTIGASGAVSSQTGVAKAGFTVTKNAAAGRYDITFGRKYVLDKSYHVSMVGPASSAFPTTTGSQPQFRQVSDDRSALIVQFVRTDTQADADAASGTEFEVTAIMSDAP